MSNRIVVITAAVLVGGVIGYLIGQYTGGETALLGALTGGLIMMVLK